MRQHHHNIDHAVAMPYGWFLEVKADLILALRSLARAPVFTVVAILTIALGVGANSTVFSLAKALLWQTLPVPHPENLYFVRGTYPGGSITTFSYPDFKKQSEFVAGKASFLAFGRTTLFHTSRQDGAPRPIQVQLVSEDFFRTLKVSPVLGRDFNSGDNRLGATPVAIISHSLWQRYFNSEGATIGKTITIRQTQFTIIGVMNQSFPGVEPRVRTELWAPLAMQSPIGYSGPASFSDGADWRSPWLNQEGAQWLHIMTRAPAGLPVNHIRAMLDDFLRRQIAPLIEKETDPRQRQMLKEAHLELDPAGNGLPELEEKFSRPLVILGALVALLLFVCCINLANLLLARAQKQKGDIALRMSLGARRMRLIRQLLTESLVLALLGGLASLPVAYGSRQLLLRWLAESSDTQFLTIESSPSALLFTAAISVAAAILFGLLPALRATQVDLSNTLRVAGGGRSTRSHTRGILDRTLVAAQIAFSIVSLIVAGLLTKTLFNYSALDVGFERVGVLSASIDTSGGGYNSTTQPILWRRLTESIEAIPGVESAAVSGCGLLTNCVGTVGVEIPGYSRLRGENVSVQRNFVGPKYFETVGMPIRSGRGIEERDVPGARMTAVVNSRFETQYFGAGRGLDRRLIVDGQTYHVVGVVRNARVNDIHQAPQPMIYFPILQYPVWMAGTIEVRVKGGFSGSVAEQLPRSVQKVDRQVPVGVVLTVQEETNRNLFNEMILGRLTGTFSLLTLALSCLGLYGLLSYRIAGRRAEIGLRMAIGATPSGVVLLVLREALIVIMAGVVAGLVFSIFASQLVSSLLYGTGAMDVTVYVEGLILLTITSLLAAILPALRAASVDPLRALRME